MRQKSHFTRKVSGIALGTLLIFGAASDVVAAPAGVVSSWPYRLSVLVLVTLMALLWLLPLWRRRRQDQSLRDKLARLAKIDPLAELPSRGAFFAHAITVLEAAERQGLPVTLLKLDVEYNASSRRPDEADSDMSVLRAVTHAVLRVVTPFPEIADRLLARLGRDEFALMVTGLDDRQAQRMAERISARVWDICYAPDGTLVSPTVSIGVAMREAHMNIGAMLTAAEDATVVARRMGQGRCCVAARRRGQHDIQAHRTVSTTPVQVDAVLRFENAVDVLRKAANAH